MSEPTLRVTATQRLGQGWCALIHGHSEEGKHCQRTFNQTHVRLECTWCGWKSEGWQVHTVGLADCRQVYDDMIQVELGLHGGG